MPAIVAALAGGLRRRGFKVLVAHDGQAALAVIEGHDDGIDLLVSDVMIPGMNGIELARAALRVRPGLAVLLSAGYAFDAIEKLGGHRDEFPMMSKPYSVASLVARIREVLA